MQQPERVSTSGSRPAALRPSRRPARVLARSVLVVGVLGLVAATAWWRLHHTAPLAAATPTGPADKVVANASVVRVIDGDTVDLRIGRKRERVRLIGINTPETVDPRRPVECFGPQAKTETKHLLPPGTRVRLERDVEPRDDYGRLLGYITRASDGLFVNMHLAEQGFAVPLSIAPNTAHAPGFAEAARQAESAGRGLWGSCPR